MIWTDIFRLGKNLAHSFPVNVIVMYLSKKKRAIFYVMVYINNIPLINISKRRWIHEKEKYNHAPFRKSVRK